MTQTDDTAEPEGADGPTGQGTNTSSGGRSEQTDEHQKPVGPTVNNKFTNARLYYPNFGISAPQRVAVALKRAADVDAELSRYVRPPCFPEALEALRSDHVVTLEGRNGSGRQTGALALLREVISGDLVPISPATSLKELGTFRFARGRGYYLLDHISPEAGSEAEFYWQKMCDRIRHRGSYLVTTILNAPRYARRVVWERPDLVGLLSVLLGCPSETAISDLLGRIPGDWSLNEVAQLCRRLDENPDNVQQALGVFELIAAEEVRTWFADEKRQWPDYVEVAALTFAWGTSPREFESMVDGLEQAIAAHLPARAPEDEYPERMLNRRQRRSRLIVPKRVTYSGIPRQTLGFQSLSHCREVLEHLWSTQAVPFWNGVRDWLHSRVESDRLNGEQLAQIAQGVALLAHVNAEEAITSYLDPFAEGELGENGILCASAILRLMSLDESLAPIALRIAVEWIGGPLTNRIAAAEALMAELGARYPAEAAKRLWQLIAQDDELKAIAFTAPAGLLETLVELEGDAMPLLELLCRQAARLGESCATLETADRTLRTIQYLLQSVDEPSRQLTSFRLLLAHPETAPQLGRLWAALLANLRYRPAALEAIWDGLQASRDQAALAELLTKALAAALSAYEQTRFVRDFTVIDGRKRRRDRTWAASLAHLLIDAIARTHSADSQETR